MGLGNHPVQYPAYARSAVVDPFFSTRYQLDFAHNEYLQTWAELGIVGLGLMLWLATAVLRTLSQALARARRSASVDPWTMAASAGILGIGVDAFLNFPFHCALPPLVSIVYLGLVASGSPQRAIPLAARTLRVGLALGSLALATTAWCYLRWIQADLHIRRMHDAEARHDWTTVLSQAEAARLMNPHAPEPPLSMGAARIAAGEPLLAAQSFEEVVAMRPYDLPALANLALAYMQARDTAKALDRQRRALALEPGEALFHFRAAVLLEASGDDAGALGEHRLAAGDEPRSRLYQYRWGLSAMKNKSFAEAERALVRALALDPRSAATHKALGILLVTGLGRRAEGVEQLRTALGLDPAIQDHDQMRQLVDAYDREQARPPRPAR